MNSQYTVHVCDAKPQASDVTYFSHNKKIYHLPTFMRQNMKSQEPVCCEDLAVGQVDIWSWNLQR